MRHFLTQLLDEYGLPLERFAGIGTVESEGETTPVDWASAQYGDGQVPVSYTHLTLPTIYSV